MALQKDLESKAVAKARGNSKNKKSSNKKAPNINKDNEIEQEIDEETMKQGVIPLDFELVDKGSKITQK